MVPLLYHRMKMYVRQPLEKRLTMFGGVFEPEYRIFCPGEGPVHLDDGILRNYGYSVPLMQH